MVIENQDILDLLALLVEYTSGKFAHANISCLQQHFGTRGYSLSIFRFSKLHNGVVQRNTWIPTSAWLLYNSNTGVSIIATKILQFLINQPAYLWNISVNLITNKHSGSHQKVYWSVNWSANRKSSICQLYGRAGKNSMFLRNTILILQHLLIIFPARSLFFLVSLGCLNRYMTALPIPLTFNAPLSTGGSYHINECKVNKNIHTFRSSFMQSKLEKKWECFYSTCSKTFRIPSRIWMCGNEPSGSGLIHS